MATLTFQIFRGEGGQGSMKEFRCETSEGMKADVAVFDPATVRDTATYDQPHQYAEGFALVIVNGQIVFERGQMTTARPGRVLYGPGK